MFYVFSVCIRTKKGRNRWFGKRNKKRVVNNFFSECLVRIKTSITFANANTKEMVPWMSALVTGLQNRLRRFESARNLKKGLEFDSNPFFYALKRRVFAGQVQNKGSADRWM